MQDNILNDTIKALETNIYNLNISLRIEQIKNKLYRQIIEKNTNIKINDVFEEKEDSIRIYNSEYGINIPIVVHEENNIQKQKHKRKKIKNKKPPESPFFVIEEEPENIKDDSEEENDEEHKKYSNDYKRKFKTAKNKIEIVNELTEDQKNNIIHKIEAKRNEEINELSIINQEVNHIFENCFVNLKQSRIYKKSLTELKQARIRLIEFTPLQDYIKLLKDHNTKLKTIFTNKNYTEKKIEMLIGQSMYPLELRLTWHKTFITSFIEIDEIEKFSKCLSLSITFPQSYEPFNRNNLFLHFHNYGSAFFSLRKNIEMYLFNPYGFNNVIYLPIKEPTQDPYTFYILERVDDNGNRYWHLDCRLEELCTDFNSNIRLYFITLFRQIYYEVFNDNEYRADYLNRGQIMECDCEQIIQSVLLLNNIKEFCKTFRNIVREKATHNATIKDKINMYGDDPLQKKRFNNPTKNDPDIIDVVKELFDNMKTEDAVDFYRHHTSNIV